MQHTTSNNIPIYDIPWQEGEPGGPIRIITARDHPLKQEDIWLTPHRKDYYLLMYVTKGSGRHWVDMMPYEFQPGMCYFSSPEQVYIKENAKVSGTVITFSREFLALEQNRNLARLPLLQNPQHTHALKIDPGHRAELEYILERCVQEFRQDEGLQMEMLCAYVRVLLVFLSRIYNNQYHEHAPGPARELYRRFQSCMEENYRHIHRVADYAAMLNISVSHLNAQIRAQSGKTVMMHIHERLILEAGRLLFYTDLSVKEIAYGLGFHDTSYFNRFFKKMTGLTPVAYRQKISE